MPTVRERDLGDLIGDLPDWTPVCGCPSAVFIGAVGFEDRSSDGFIHRCSFDACGVRRAILVQYPTNVEDNVHQFESFKRAAAENHIDVTFVTYNRRSIFGEIQRILSEFSVSSIVCDISTMASYVFYPIFSAIFASKVDISLTVIYTEATNYFPTVLEWKEFQTKVSGVGLLEKARLFDEFHFQSIGVDFVYESVNFPGRNADCLPARLVVVPNFCFERVNQMITYASDRYSIARENCEWLIGMPPNQDQNGWRHEALWELFGCAEPKHDVSTLAYKEIIVALNDIWLKGFGKESILLTTVGSKSQHLGTLLFLLMHPEVGVVLSEPKSFSASKYSNGVGKAWCLQFGVIHKLLKRLRSWNEIEFSW